MKFVIERRTVFDGHVPTVFEDGVEVVFSDIELAEGECAMMKADAEELRVVAVPDSWTPRPAP